MQQNRNGLCVLVLCCDIFSSKTWSMQSYLSPIPCLVIVLVYTKMATVGKIAWLLIVLWACLLHSFLDYFSNASQPFQEYKNWTAVLSLFNLAASQKYMSQGKRVHIFSFQCYFSSLHHKYYAWEFLNDEGELWCFESVLFSLSNKSN